jgi:diguanylate cyclase (GGDEF)-like protein
MPDDHTTDPQLDDRTIVINPADLADAPTIHKASLVVVSGWEIGKQIELTTQEHVIGRSLLASTRINSPSVSREHAKLVRVHEAGEEYYIVTDLNSSNGTRVNGETATSARLQNGDKIQMGDVVFKFVLEDAVDVRFYKDIHQLIHYDQLTGLLKMDAFKRELDAEIQKAHHRDRFTLAMTDLDGLKRVNDHYGHLAGRMVVREMGAMIRQSIRPQDRAGLYGGDESIMFYPGAPLEEAAQIAERIRQTIQGRVFEIEGNTFGVTISQGLSEWPKHGKTIEQLIAAADKALYDAKAGGRNCTRFAPD